MRRDKKRAASRFRESEVEKHVKFCAVEQICGSMNIIANQDEGVFAIGWGIETKKGEAKCLTFLWSFLIEQFEYRHYS